MAEDPYDLDRFVQAQAGVYETALDELRRGCKRSHWMWFVFPQLRGLGVSSTARFYGIGGLEEAQAYLVHPVLGGRLAEATTAVLAHPDKTLNGIFGSPDDLKFISSMSLFALALDDRHSPFQAALQQWNGGRMDPRTLALLGRG